jgi:hypothetical protein
LFENKSETHILGSKQTGILAICITEAERQPAALVVSVEKSAVPIADRRDGAEEKRMKRRSA